MNDRGKSGDTEGRSPVAASRPEQGKGSAADASDAYAIRPLCGPAPVRQGTGQWAFGMLKGMLKASSGLVVLATVPLFLVFANTQIKELADGFIGGCVLVLDKHLSAAGQLLVTARIAGTMPKGLPLMFEGRDSLINTVLFDEPFRQGRIAEPDDLAFHPLTGAKCPGDLCPDSGSEPLRSRVQILLRDLRPEFTYRFRIRAQPDSGPLGTQHLKVYAMFDSGLADGVCRVQPRRWFNFWVWATPGQKSVLFISVVVIGGLLLRWARSATEGVGK